MARSAPGRQSERKARSSMMGTRSLRLTCLPILAAVLLGAGRETSFKEEMQFGIEAAQRGLWREAIFRWEKHLKNTRTMPACATIWPWPTRVSDSSTGRSRSTVRPSASIRTARRSVITTSRFRSFARAARPAGRSPKRLLRLLPRPAARPRSLSGYCVGPRAWGLRGADKERGGVDGDPSATTSDAVSARNPHAPAGFGRRGAVCVVAAPRRWIPVASSRRLASGSEALRTRPDRIPGQAPRRPPPGPRALLDR